MKKRIGVTIISLPGGLEMLMWFCIACPKIDQQPQLRTEKEQARLQTDAATIGTACAGDYSGIVVH